MPLTCNIRIAGLEEKGNKPRERKEEKETHKEKRKTPRIRKQTTHAYHQMLKIVEGKKFASLSFGFVVPSKAQKSGTCLFPKRFDFLAEVP